jgi:hypothetical protein
MQHATSTAERVAAVLSAANLQSAQGKPNGGLLRPRTGAAILSWSQNYGFFSLEGLDLPDQRAPCTQAGMIARRG